VPKFLFKLLDDDGGTVIVADEVLTFLNNELRKMYGPPEKTVMWN